MDNLHCHRGDLLLKQLEGILNIFLFSSFIFVVTTLYFNSKKAVVIYLKKYFLPIIGLFFIAALIAFPKTSVSSASKGIQLWLNIVFPSLFPFFVASSLLSKSGFINIFGIILEPVMRPLFNVPGCGAFALAMGIVSGYPIGASITTDLRKQELISRIEAERLLTFTNNSGPLFIMGAVAVGMFKLPAAGYLLYISHISACITVGLIFKYYKQHNRSKPISQSSILYKLKLEMQRMRSSEVNIWTLFGECIKTSISTILAIGGFIIFFSVLINILITSGITGYISNSLFIFLSKFGFDLKTIEGSICGIFEITTGANMISSSPADLRIKLCFVSLIIGWAGLSVHTQVMSIVSSSDIRVKPYLIGKAMQGIISAAYTFIGYTLFSRLLFSESPVFAYLSNNYISDWSSVLKISLQNIAILSLIVLFITIVSMCLVRFNSKRSLL